MLRWAPGFLVAAVIAILVGLLETLVAATSSFFCKQEQKGERSLQ